LWNAADGTQVWRTDFLNKPVVVTRFSPDGRTLAVGTWGWRVALWRLDDLTAAPRILHLDDVPIYSAIDDIAFHPSGQRIAAATKSGLVRVWDLTTQNVLYDLRATNNPPPQSRTPMDHALTGERMPRLCCGNSTGLFLTAVRPHRTYFFNEHRTGCRSNVTSASTTP
jgi:WD40 repeat protein